MKSSTFVWIVVVIIIILGGWYFFIRGPVATAPTQPQSGVQTQSRTPSQAAPGPAANPGPSTALGLNGGAGQTNTGQVSVPPLLTASSSTALGSYLVASNGMTLYRYTKDTSSTSTCYDACATAWPPYLVETNEPLMAGAGISGQLGTTTRTDGSAQLTYKGVPLYFWQKDQKPGDTTGQNVGGVWFVVKP